MRKLLLLVFLILPGDIKHSQANDNNNLEEDTIHEENLKYTGNKYSPDKVDLFSSIAGLERVLQVESLLMKNLNEYITRSMELITNMKLSIIKKKKAENFNFIKESIFLLDIRGGIQQLKMNIQSFKESQEIIRTENFQSVPDPEDLNGVVNGIFLIQNIYNITTDQLIYENITESIQTASKLSASDCFHMGLTLSGLKHHSYAIEWFKHALKLLNIKRNQLIVEKIDEINIIKHLVHSQYAVGDMENAFSAVIETIITIQKDLMHDDSIEMASSLSKYMDHYKNLKNSHKSFEILTKMDRPYDALKTYCPRSDHKPPHIVKTLFCKYESKNHAYLKLAPFKMEIQNLDPYIAVFHDVISSSEIEILKNLSLTNLDRALVDGEGGVKSYRTAKNYFFENDEHPIIDILQQRVSDMTGLSMDTSEEFQIANYGIGGWYDLHYDANDLDAEMNIDVPNDLDLLMGDRIATVLFYMSDVEHGGATVLPIANTTIFPKQGTAAFWYNLHASGNLDHKTLHSGCPVAVGSKWILNKWIRLYGQYNRRLCLTYPDHIYDAIYVDK